MERVPPAAGRRRGAWLLALAVAAAAAGAVAAQREGASFPASPDGLELLGWPDGASGFAGSDTCAACHGGIAAAQDEHPMARTAAALTGETLDLYFPAERLALPVRWRSDGEGRAAYARVDGGVELRGDGDDPGASVHAIFGSGLRGETPVHFPGDGAMRELRVSWSEGLGSWIETPGSEGDRDALGDLDPPEATADCVGCHATAIRWEGGAPAAEGSEWGVRCERCHGPGRPHAARWATGTGGEVFNPGDLPPAAQVRFCGQCHRLPSDIEPLEILRRDRALARHAGASLMMSACFRESPPESALSCLSCHDAHEHELGASAGGSVAERSRAACLGCHADPAAAHRYERVTTASDCLACHLPRQEEVFPGAAFTDHWIRVRGAPPAPGSPVAEAEIAWLELLYRNALSEPQRPRNEARLAIGLGELLQAQGLRDSAIASIRRGLDRDPGYGRLLKAAAILREEGEAPLAITALERAAAMDPEAAQAHFDLGDLRLANGDAGGAVRSLERARELRPASALVLARLGAAHRASGDSEAALEAGLAAVERTAAAPADAASPDAALEAWLELGITHRARRETAPAAEALRNALQRSPDWPPVLDALARLLALDPDESLRDLPEAIRLAERLAGFSGYQEPASLDLLAAVHAAAGDFELAVRAAELALAQLAAEGVASALAEGLRDRLALYRNGQAFVEPPPVLRLR